MAKFKVNQRFRDRQGKDTSKYSHEKILSLPVIETTDVYDSTDKKWTDYLVGEGFLSPLEESNAAPKTPTKKRASSKKEGE